jgi:ClpP class serine protease
LKYQHIIRAVLARPWAIDPESLAWAAVLDVLSLRAAGDRLTDEEISARIAAAQNGPRAGGRRDRNVAVIPMYGVLSPKGDAFARSSGGTTAETLRDEFRAAVADPDIDGIVFDVDSPGGVVEGIGELADEIRGARGTKPIAAVANHMAASAAYWAIAGVDEIVATPSASVGSIGVFTAHQDVSAAMEEKGVKTTLISAGKYKVEGNQFEALGGDGPRHVRRRPDLHGEEGCGGRDGRPHRLTGEHHQTRRTRPGRSEAGRRGARRTVPRRLRWRGRSG